MAEDNTMRAKFSLTIGNEDTRSKPDDFANSEIERTRRFKYKDLTVPRIGSIEDLRLLVKYDRTGGTCNLDYVENVIKRRISGGKTYIGLLDSKDAILIEWDHPLFRKCGRHSQSFESSITRVIAEKVTGLQFRTNRWIPAKKC